MTIEELQREVESESLQAALKPLIPRGWHARVTLRGPERKKRNTASADSWSPETGDTVLIRFEPANAPETPGASETNPVVTPAPAKGHLAVAPAPSRPTSNPLGDLVCALDRAESRPGFEFVALKWFRDTALVEEGFAWAQAESARQSVLRDAIANRLILTNKVENPRSPQFPVTTIRLNRLLPEVQATLRGSGQGGDDFEPVPIKGEPLSATILRDRR
jgi:hypothetical protein